MKWFLETQALIQLDTDETTPAANSQTYVAGVYVQASANNTGVVAVGSNAQIDANNGLGIILDAGESTYVGSPELGPRGAMIDANDVIIQASEDSTQVTVSFIRLVDNEHSE